MTILSLILTLVVYALIFYVLWWALGALALPEPFAKVIQVILVVAAVIILIGLLTGGVAPFAFLSTSTTLR